MKSLPSYHQHYNQIISILKEGNYQKLNETNDDSKSFDDITIIKFKGNNNEEFFGVVYDDWELSTNPIVAKVIRSMPSDNDELRND